MHALMLLCASYAFFVPPPKWELADTSLLSSRVQVAFFHAAQQGKSPSINLTEESTSVSPEEYLKAVQKLHETSPGNRWRNLGKIQTAAGEAFLTEIDISLPSGSLRMLQMILVREGRAYILTGAAPKEAFSRYLSAFRTSFQSLQIMPDLLSAISDEQKRSAIDKRLSEMREALTHLSFEDKKFQDTHWKPFEKTVLSECQDLGPHFQLLLLKTSYGIKDPQLKENGS